VTEPAERLREMMAAGRRLQAPPAPEGPQVLVVGSGKGGVGKSLVSVLLATAVAAQGRRVLLFDADHNLGNLHVLLGVRPVGRIEHLLHGASPDELVQPVGDGLWLLPSDSGAEALHGLEALERARLHHRLTTLYDGYDVVVVDAGAGLEGVVRMAMLRASRLVAVTVPEPTALTDAYALMKLVSLQLPELPIDVIVNRALDEADGRQAYERLAAATERFLRRGIRYLGAIPEDTMVRAAVRDPQHLLELLSASPAGHAVRELLSDRIEMPLVARCLA
jgi:flagellar biosynthesis protein FlhG